MMNASRRQWILLGFCTVLSQSTLAGLSIPTLAQSPLSTESNALAQAGLMGFQDEVIDDKDFQLSSEQTIQARVWGLSEAEEKRYLKLMQSRSGVYYHNLNLTPIDILGLNARDDSERKHFANIAVKQEAQKVAQNIAWNNAFHQAYDDFFKDVPIVGNFDPAPYSPYAHQPIKLQPGEQLYFFVKEDDAATTILLQLIDAISHTSKSMLHLLFVDMNNDAIQKWAKRQQIPLDLVQSKKITLQCGNKQFEKIVIQHKHTPLLLLAKNGASHVVDLGKF